MNEWGINNLGRGYKVFIISTIVDIVRATERVLRL